MSWVLLDCLLLCFRVNSHLLLVSWISNPCKTSTMSTWRIHWLKKLLDITLQQAVLTVFTSMVVHLQCFLRASPLCSGYLHFLSTIHRLDFKVCLVVPELGSNSSYTSRTKPRSPNLPFKTWVVCIDFHECLLPGFWRLYGILFKLFQQQIFSRLGLKYIGDQLQAKRLGSEHF